MIERLHKACHDEMTRPETYSREEPFSIHDLGLCSRLRYFRAKGIEPQIDMRGHGIRMFGKLMEEWFAEALAAHFLDVVRQFVVRDPEWRICGHADFYLPPERVIIEHKSVGINAPVPIEHHLFQIHGYLVFSHDAADYGILAYTRREDPQQYEFIRVEPNKLWKERIIAIHSLDLWHYENDIEPTIPEDFTPSRFPCLWRSRSFERKCDYYHLCWKPDEQEGQAATPTSEMVAEIVDRFLKARDAKHDAEVEYENARAALLACAREEQTELRGSIGKVLIETITSQRLDTRALKLMHPDIFEHLARETTTQRIRVIEYEGGD